MGWRAGGVTGATLGSLDTSWSLSRALLSGNNQLTTLNCRTRDPILTSVSQLSYSGFSTVSYINASIIYFACHVIF